MKCLARHTLNALTVLSLLLCVSAVALRVRSSWREDVLQWGRPGHHDAFAAVTDKGGLLLIYRKLPERWWDFFSLLASQGMCYESGGTSDLYAPAVSMRMRRIDADIIFARFRYLKGETSDGINLRGAVLPLMGIAGASGLAAAMGLVSVRRDRKARRRRQTGRCVACGYDLRATPDRCPECGVIPSRSAT